MQQDYCGRTSNYIFITLSSNYSTNFPKYFATKKPVLLYTKCLKLLKTTTNIDASDSRCGDIIDLRRRNKTSMAVKEKTAIEFDSRKYKKYFEFIWSESKNIEAVWMLQAGNKTLQLVDYE